MNENIIIDISGGQPTVTSRDVAEHFGKRHSDVLEAIKNMTTENSALQNMFREISYTANNKQTYPMYQITRDGFSLLVMGFTGKEALAWKLKYIQAFNAMEEQLKAKEIQAAMPKVDARMIEAQARLNNSRADVAKLLIKVGDSAAFSVDRGECYKLALYALTGQEMADDKPSFRPRRRALYLKD